MASQRDLAKQLLQRAGDDEAAARAMLPIEAVTDAIVGMLAQQGVEKLVDREVALRWATAAVTWARAQVESSVADAEDEESG